MAIASVEMAVDPQQWPASPTTWEGGWPQTLAEFERLVEMFQDRLVRYAFRRLGNIQDAEDVAQEVFVRAYADRAQRRSVSSVSAYLYRMASNLATDHLRKRKHPCVSIEEPEVLEIPTSQPSASDAASAAEELRRVEAVLGRIPQRQAEVVRLKVLDGLRLGDIAGIVGCSLATAKSRLRYGLEKLREIVLQEWRI